MQLSDFYIATQQPKPCIAALQHLCKQYGLKIDFYDNTIEETTLVCADDTAVSGISVADFARQLDEVCKKFATEGTEYGFLLGDAQASDFEDIDEDEEA